MEVCKEMQKLRTWLDEHDIPWHDQSEDMGHHAICDFWICRTKIEMQDEISVINGYGTYGGFSPAFDREEVNQGLLEVWCKRFNDGEVTGYLTADDVIEFIKREYLKQEFSVVGLMNDIVREDE